MSEAIWLGFTHWFSGGFVAPCDCHPRWDRFRVGNLCVRECKLCGATWTERHRASTKTTVIM